MEDVFGGTGAGGADFAIEVHGVPGSEAAGFVGREVGLHGEIGFREVEGVFERHFLCGRGGGVLHWCTPAPEDTVRRGVPAGRLLL